MQYHILMATFFLQQTPNKDGVPAWPEHDTVEALFSLYMFTNGWGGTDVGNHSQTAETEEREQSTSCSHQPPLEHPTMQYSWSTSEPVKATAQPRGALNLLHKPAAWSGPALRSLLSVKVCSHCRNVLWKPRSPSLPLTQRANAPLKMHILAAPLVYLMHMDHTSGTKRNDIAPEYPWCIYNSDLCARRLPLWLRLNLWKFENCTCWNTWVLPDCLAST